MDTGKGIIIFIRHGQTDWNTCGKMQGREEIPLNEVGLEQAVFASRGLKEFCKKTGFKFTKVISSPLSRASVTGKMIAEAVGCDTFYCDERIIERDFGVLSGKPYDKASRYITGDVCEIPSLEPVSALVERVNEFIRDNASVNDRIICVTHGAVTRIYADQAKKADGYEIKAPFLENCHLVVYSYDGTEPVLEGYNVSPCELDKLIYEGK
ncbi:MAG: histidine phosphatase family protein [Clostridia bacterium]|nr:histidine phosphatase family protein [Clostridia bacterium]